jgi:hypothetical protein
MFQLVISRYVLNVSDSLTNSIGLLPKLDQNALDAMEGAMIEDSETCRFEREIRTGVARVQDKLIHSLERNIDKFELYVCRNIFRVPDHIDLSVAVTSAPSSDSQTLTTEEEMRLEEDLAALQRKILNAEFVNKAMKQKMAALDEQLASFAPLSKVMDEAASRIREHGPEDGLPAAMADVLAHEAEIRAIEKQQGVLEAVSSYFPTTSTRFTAYSREPHHSTCLLANEDEGLDNNRRTCHDYMGGGGMILLTS